MEIKQINLTKMTDELNRLVRYARECSWQGTGAYFAECLEDTEYRNIENVVAAYDEQKIIGFGALVSESCIENTSFSPWLDFLYVEDRYRNNGIAKAMAESLFREAQSDGVEKLYLCTVSHERMYEKLGFVTLYKTFINQRDECFVMEKML